jgi:hypothetical protein
MGLWWKHVDSLPVGMYGISYPEVPGGVTKNVPILWRFRMPWQVFQVGETFSLDDINPYYVYFKSNGVVMRYRRKLTTPYVALRVGADAVQFVVEDIWTHKELPLTELIRTTKRGVPGNPFYELLRLAELVSWI